MNKLVASLTFFSQSNEFCSSHRLGFVCCPWDLQWDLEQCSPRLGVFTKFSPTSGKLER